MRKFRLRNAQQEFLFLFNYHKPSKKPNVLIFSLPRSGSTWLQELIWTQKGFKYANEPLNLKGRFLQKKSKINGFKELYTLGAKNKVLSYFKRITNGNFHILDPSPLRKNTRFFTSRVVFKVIHGGELFINELAQHTNSKVIYLLRNPIAVSLSRRQLPRTDELTSDLVLSIFNDAEKKVIEEIMKSGDDMEKRILMWCIQNRLILEQKTEDWLIISYEHLTTTPERIIDEITKHCQLSEIEKMTNSVDIPSAVSIQSETDSVNLMQGNMEKRKALISKWRTKVEDSDAKKYFEICKKMNIPFYDFNSDLPKSNLIFT